MSTQFPAFLTDKNVDKLPDEWSQKIKDIQGKSADELSDESSPEITDIQYHLGIDNFLAKQFAEQFIRFKNIRQHFEPNGLLFDDKDADIKKQLKLAEKALEYKLPYRIAFVGSTGAGKSALINALIGGRELLPSHQVSSVTGTIITVFFVPKGNEEKAIIVPRQQNHIFTLIEDFIKEYEIDEELPNELSEDISEELLDWQSTRVSLSDRETFEKIRYSLANIVKCYVRHSADDDLLSFLIPSELRGNLHKSVNGWEMPLSSQMAEYLWKVVDEGNPINKDEYRKIDLIESISYQITSPDYSENQPQFKLPRNVCLVDLPGFSTDIPMHNLLFIRGVEEANVVVLTVSPERLPENNSPLYNLVKKNINSSESIFLVVNLWDKFHKDIHEEMSHLQARLKETTQYLGIKNDYKTSAFVAFYSQLAQQEKAVNAPDSYENAARSLGVKPQEYDKALEASNIPTLTRDMTDFIENRLIPSEIEKGKKALDAICQLLREKYDPLENSSLEKEIMKSIGKCQKKVESILREFHKEHVSEIDSLLEENSEADDEESESLGNALVHQANRICDQIDRHLKKVVPEFWEKCYTNMDEENFLFHNYYEGQEISWITFLSYVELEFWKVLPRRMKVLADILTTAYRKALEQHQIKQHIYDNIAFLTSSVKIADVLEGFEDEIKEMERKLTELSEHVALLQVFDEEVLLAPKEKGEQIDSELKEALEQLPSKEQELSPDEDDFDDFDDFLQVARSRYEQVVAKWSIDKLLDFYKYQMAYIETALREKSIERFFSNLRRLVYTSPNLFAEKPEAKKRKIVAELCSQDK
ncbi:MAG: dynamin family protein [Candidatus Parabeggiatoa sp.]|nr:dynamin family protein [Candidatus Parabeggiatoa sp.]